MGKPPPPDERVVYMALKDIFKGQNAEVRQNKTIRKILQKHSGQKPIVELVREHNFDVVCSSARTLLCEEIFASTLKAKERFPEPFDPSPAQSEERETSEAEAAPYEMDAIEDAVQGGWDGVELAGDQQGAADEVIAEAAWHEADAIEDEPAGYQQVAADEVIEEPECEYPRVTVLEDMPSTDPTSLVLALMPPLFPMYLPFRSQHKLLVHMQTLLEHACYDFGKRARPDILRERGWDCPESLELSIWTREFSSYLRKTFPDTEERIGKPLGQLLASITQIRHIAVHRNRIDAESKPIDAKAIEQFLLDAQELAILLGDSPHIAKITELLHDIQATLKELERGKAVLRLWLEETLRGIKAQWADAIASVEMEDEECRMQAGKGVEDSIVPSETSFSTAVDTERETVIDLEDMLAPSEASFSTAIDAEEETMNGLDMNGTNEDGKDEFQYEDELQYEEAVQLSKPEEIRC